MPDVATVEVPASTSNLGPGYDCLGIAFRWRNRVTVRRAARPARPGELAAHPMASGAAALFFERAEARPFRLAVSVSGEVPRSRGLGSSVTLRLGLLHGLNALCGRPFSRRELFRLCAELEGHPDNAAPASFGGFTAASRDDCFRFPISPKLKFVLLIPELEVETARARALLPRRVPFADAAAAVGRVARITAAFAAGDYRRLRGAFADPLHQPSRRALVPFLDAAIGAAERAGALGGFLSGSGSSVVAVTLSHERQIAAAMLAAARGFPARAAAARADNRGARLLEVR